MLCIQISVAIPILGLNFKRIEMLTRREGERESNGGAKSSNFISEEELHHLFRPNSIWAFISSFPLENSSPHFIPIPFPFLHFFISLLQPKNTLAYHRFTTTHCSLPISLKHSLSLSLSLDLPSLTLNCALFDSTRSQ